DNASRCTLQVCEFGLDSPLVLSHPAAAKTGTTNDFTDNWTLGYTPQIVTGVWAGNADHSPMVNVIGVTGAAPIWHDFMEGAFRARKLPRVPFVAPPSVPRSAVCTSPRTTTTSPYGTATVQSTSQYVPDIHVTGDQTSLCRIADRGSMPISCTDYPQP